MEIYTVGGWVRDKLINPLSIPHDRDHLIVGANEEDIADLLFLKFEQVGKDFPVFLHPDTKEEFALARVERKTGVGYSGFDCYSGMDVTLEQDLSRRDLTINAMAFNSLNKHFGPECIVDPFGGLQDIADKILRHTSEAFVEDPVRVLRIARFMAKFGPEWKIHSSTQALMQVMKFSGELDHLSPDRVWKETEKALQEPYPELFFETLKSLEIFPEHSVLFNIPQPPEHHPEGDVGIHTRMVIQQAVKLGASPETIFSCLCHDFGKVMFLEEGHLRGHESFGVPIVESFCKKWKVPNKFRDLAIIVTEFHGKVHQVMGRENQEWVKPKSILNLFEATGAIKDPMRFKKFLQACEADARGRLGFEDREYLCAEYLTECLVKVLCFDTKSVSIPMKEAGKSGLLIKEAIRVNRIKIIKDVMLTWKFKG